MTDGWTREYVVEVRHAELIAGSPFSNPFREEIVRCRDCKHFTPKGTHKFENGKVNADYCTYVRGWMLQITPDGFCAWSVRRGE